MSGIYVANWEISFIDVVDDEFPCFGKVVDVMIVIYFKSVH